MLLHFPEEFHVTSTKGREERALDSKRHTLKGIGAFHGTMDEEAISCSTANCKIAGFRSSSGRSMVELSSRGG